MSVVIQIRPEDFKAISRAMTETAAACVKHPAYKPSWESPAAGCAQCRGKRIVAMALHAAITTAAIAKIVERTEEPFLYGRRGKSKPRGLIVQRIRLPKKDR